MISTLFRKVLALALALICGWTLAIYGVGHVRSTSLKDVDDSKVPLNVPAYLSADALIIIAEKQVSLIEPEKLALRALSQDPANGGAAAFLLALFVAEGREAEAASIADLAGRLWPVHIYTHSRLADYWIAQNRVDKLLPELSLLMIREPSWRRTVFPFLEQLTVGAGKIELLEPFINRPPSWWDSFFLYLSNRLDITMVSDLYERRVVSTVDVSEAERESYVGRLVKDKQWNEAFKQWRAGLSSAQASLIVNGLFDGGFEAAGASSREFGWAFGRHKGFIMKPRATYGVNGKQALQLFFKRGLNRIRFKHLSQRLLLVPGDYRLSYKARADALKNPKGLIWRIRCESQEGQLLAEGEPLVGRHQWQDRSFSFTVPDSCLVQSLVLEAASKYPHELVFGGKLWLDDISLAPVLKRVE